MGAAILKPYSPAIRQPPRDREPRAPTRMEAPLWGPPCFHREPRLYVSRQGIGKPVLRSVRNFPYEGRHFETAIPGCTAQFQGRGRYRALRSVRKLPDAGRHVFLRSRPPAFIRPYGSGSREGRTRMPARELTPRKCRPVAAMALTPVLRRLRGRRVVLASASPRRLDILGYTGLRFEVVPSRFPETLDPAAFATPHDYARENARRKAVEVALRLREKDQRAPDVVIGADTVVAIDGLILEKPRDKEDALWMLRLLSGREHSVITAVAVVLLPPTSSPGVPAAPQPPPVFADDPEVTTFHEETRVTFSALTDELLRDYVDSGEPMDKAGGYALQALGAMLVERADGDFLGAVGFPLNRFCRELQRLLGAADPDPPTATPDSKSADDPATS